MNLGICCFIVSVATKVSDSLCFGALLHCHGGGIRRHGDGVAQSQRRAGTVPGAPGRCPGTSTQTVRIADRGSDCLPAIAKEKTSSVHHTAQRRDWNRPFWRFLNFSRDFGSFCPTQWKPEARQLKHAMQNAQKGRT